ncbi:DNA polymerase lambda-like isoform X1 [Diadema setosum]|uniref:DNA polymerase lambda-like isoform X1 n=1 Tax=Diadema setosum TaxID=31175 RepID=UPI003B3B4A3B
MKQDKETSASDSGVLPPNKKRKTNTSPGKPSKQETSDKTSASLSGIFCGIKVFVLQAGLGKARTDLFKKQLNKHGAQVQMAIGDGTTHVIVDEEMTHPRFCRIMKYEEDKVPKHFQIIKAKWLSSCLSENLLVDAEEFILAPAPRVEKKAALFRQDDQSGGCSTQDTKEDQSKASTLSRMDQPNTLLNQPSTSHTFGLTRTTPSKKKPVSRGYDSDDSNYVPSDDNIGSGDEDDESDLEGNGKPTSGDGSSSNVSTPNTSPAKLPRGNWVCSKPSTTHTTVHNEHITEKLEILMKAYENTKDRWRALGYKKAISALKNYGKDVTSWEEASAIPSIGAKMADKIWEIIQSGHLRKIDFVCKGEDMEAIDLFNNVWGAGPTVARDWVQQGFRTLDDLREKAKLNKQQQIGLKHYHEFLERMSREEAGDIERTVRETAALLFPGMLSVVCGSYRRGKETCGDVDVLISHPDGKSHKGALSRILDALRETGFITDDLIKVEEKGEQRKYMGVCRLPGENRKHRRIDIIVAPYSEYPCALVHFTGSGHFNRSMRALAKKKGMSLSEHALRTGVVRRGNEKIHEGIPLPVNSEEDIFRHLGLEYREPHERDY